MKAKLPQVGLANLPSCQQPGTSFCASMSLLLLTSAVPDHPCVRLISSVGKASERKSEGRGFKSHVKLILYLQLKNFCYIYIYIYRERERENKGNTELKVVCFEMRIIILKYLKEMPLFIWKTGNSYLSKPQGTLEQEIWTLL